MLPYDRFRLSRVRLLAAFGFAAAGALCLLIAFAAQPTLGRASQQIDQSPTPCVVLPVPYRCETWVSTYAGSGSGAGIAVGIAPQNSRVMATSPDGKTVYVSGTSVSGTSSTAFVVLAFDAATGAQVWTFQYAGTTSSTNASSYALAVSPDGSAVYVTGTVVGGVATLAVDAATGTQRWAAIFSGAEAVPDIATDGNQVYVSTAAGFQDTDGSSYPKAVAIAYDAASGAQRWISHDSANPGAGSAGSKIAVSPDASRVYMAGGKLGAGGYVVDVLLFTYDAVTGAVTQETHHDSTQGFPPAGIVVSPNGSRVFVEEANIETGLNNALTLAYDSSGNALWTARYPTTCPDTNCATRPWYYGPITVSPNGSTVFVTGTYLHILNEQAFVTLAYDATTGAERWEAMYPHNLVDNIVGPIIAPNPNGREVYVTGPANNSNITTVAYDSSTGAQNWIAIHGVGSPQGIAVSPDGSQVFVAGGIVNVQTQPAGTQTDIIALAYDTTAPPLTPAPVLNSVVSRKTQGAAGAFDIELPEIGRSGIECRSGGATSDYSMIFTFANNLVAVGGAAVTNGTGSISSSAIGPQPNQYTVNLTGVANAQYISVILTDVLDSSGEIGNFSDTMGVLTGDTNADGLVNSADIGQTKSQSGQPVTSSNFREDVSGDGFINSADIGLVKSRSGTALP